MTHYALTLRTEDNETHTTINTSTDLLAAMQATGLALRNSCRNSVCGLCKCRLVEGEITYHWRKPRGLWDQEIAEGFILPCIAFAESDVIVDKLSLVKN